MHKKRKEQPLLWRIIKSFFRGIGRMIMGIIRFFREKAKERKRKRELSQNNIYNAEALLEEFFVNKVSSGSFDSFKKRLYHDSLILLIFGKRGSGKSSLGFRILENIYSNNKRKCFVLGIQQELVPKWITSINEIEEAANGGVLLVDEGAISFGARESMKAKNRELAKLMAVSRHKNLSLIFIVQNTSMLDKNVLKLADSLFVKEGSLLQLEMERAEIKKFYEKAMKFLNKVKGNKKEYVFVVDADFEGSVKYKLPSFWSEGLSKNMA